MNFNLLNSTNIHVLMFLSAALASEEYVKVTQTSHCWADRMLYFSTTAKPWVTLFPELWRTSFKNSTCEDFSLGGTFHGWTVSAGTRFPVVSNCIHLHVHADTGHSAWSLNQLSICPACPPCRQLWHQVNQLLNWANFLSLLKSTFSSDLDPPTGKQNDHY